METNKIREQLAKMLISGAAKASSTSNNEKNPNIFYASILMGVNIYVVDDSQWRGDVSSEKKTAYVTIIGGKYVIHFHETCYNELLALDNGGLKYVMGVLKHEVEHMIRGHLKPSCREMMPIHTLANIAMDCAINQYGLEKELPDYGITIQSFRELVKNPNVKPEMNSQYYYQLLLKKTKEEIEAFLKEHGLDEHMEGDPIESEYTQAIFEKYVKDVLEANQKARGNVPGHLEEDIAKLFKPVEEKIDWRSHLRLFPESVKSIQVKTTWNKPNFRFPDSKGFKRKRKCHLLFARDSSASVSTEEMLEACNEMYHLHRKGITFDVMDVDTEVNCVYPFTGEFKPVQGRGGTDFQPAIDYYNEHRKEYNGMIYFTDGECGTPKNVPQNILWIFSSKCQFNKQLPGKKTQIQTK